MAERDEAEDLGIPGIGPGRLIGRGSFGDVYEAPQLGLDRSVAVKVLHARRDNDAERARFRQEAMAMARVGEHAGIVTIIDHGFTDSGRPFLVMEYLRGGSLGDRLRDGGPLGWEVAARYGFYVARALDHVHRHGLVHADVKPENVLLDSEGLPRLGDFGIATAGFDASGRRQLVATPAHSAPELLFGEPPSVSSDLWALGSTLHALISGRAPFSPVEGERLTDLADRIVHEPRPRLGPRLAPRPVDALLDELMAKDAGDRPESAALVVEKLDGLLSRPGPRPGLRRVPVAVTAVVLLAALVVLGFAAAIALDDEAPVSATSIRLADPAGLAVGADGTLFVADSRHHVVRAVASDGSVSTVAGSGVVGYSGDGGLAVEAEFRDPSGLAVGADGTLFVADSRNHVVRAVGVDGSVSTVAGTGQPGVAGDGGPAVAADLAEPSAVLVGPDGVLYIADTRNHAIRAVAPDGTIDTMARTRAVAPFPIGLAWLDGLVLISADLPGAFRVQEDGTVVAIGPDDVKPLAVATEEGLLVLADGAGDRVVGFDEKEGRSTLLLGRP
jgi:Protein kinase domain/NHL repeat